MNTALTSSVRCRFAPSPTGNVHIGNIRTAIYNWLVARHHGGKFLLRIEDTDRERSTPEAVQGVLNAMDWLGLTIDEEPVYQSTRREAHLAMAEQLLASGHAYKEDKGNTGRGEAVIFRMPGEDMGFDDLVKGPLRKAAADLKDFVIVRSDGNPVFHLANVADDIAMNINLVIRGDDHVENTYRHLALYQALGAPLPSFAHLPMIVNHQGKPYSKRDGDAYVGDFQAKGYLPEALFNFLVLLGWAPGDDREFLSREELVALFDLDRVGSNPAQFDLVKFENLNGQYMRALPDSDYKTQFTACLAEAGLIPDDDAYLDRVIPLLKERIKKWPDTAEQAHYFFSDHFSFDEKAVRKRLQREGALENLLALREAFAALPDFTATALDEALRNLAEQQGAKPADFIHPVRVAVTGQAGGPSLFELLEVLGRDRVLDRMAKAKETVASLNPSE
ncbi:MAG: glutamate--tRNA ligase [Kiritimatiellae bacterium]|nr:glutamate--tRNA ligase [Kiritimatiellia bacterium]